MDMQRSLPQSPDRVQHSGGGHKSVRYLYIVSKGGNAHSDQIFAAMRRDMTNAAVELMYDRRTSDRRGESGSIDRERRAGDRRRPNPAEEIASEGWARVQVD